MALQAVNGSKIYIGTRVAPKGTVALSDFTPQEPQWLEIGGWTQSGSLGDTQNLITQPFISEERERQIKGTRIGGAMENTFAPLPNDPGQIRFKQAIDSCHPYAFKVEWGASCASEGPVTISVGDPGVVTWPGGHGLEAGAAVIFTPTGGNLPTDITPGTVYYVVEDDLTPTTFSVAATPGGAAIETTLAATATTITATAQPAGSVDLFYGLAIGGLREGGKPVAAKGHIAAQHRISSPIPFCSDFKRSMRSIRSLNLSSVAAVICRPRCRRCATRSLRRPTKRSAATPDIIAAALPIAVRRLTL